MYKKSKNIKYDIIALKKIIKNIKLHNKQPYSIRNYFPPKCTQRIMQMASPPVIHQCINVVILSHKKIVNIKKCSSNMLSFVSERINHPYDTLYTKLQAATSLSIFADVNNCLPRMFFSKSTKIRPKKKARGFTELTFD